MDQFTSRRSLCVYAVLTSVPGCTVESSRRPSNTPKQLPEYRGPLVDPVEMRRDFMWQQRVSALHGDRKGAFDAVVQKQGPELLVLGLTPMKTRGFSLTQKGTNIEYKQFVPFELPFAPASVLYDIHRAFFYNLLAPFPEEGVIESRFDDESIRDQFSNGHLERRTFFRVSGTQEDLVIEYSGEGYAETTPPRVTTIDNRAYGYRLIVETTSVDFL